MRDLIVTVEYAASGTRYVLSGPAPAEPSGAGPLKLGQQGPFFTFRVEGVPRNVHPEAVADRIAAAFDARGERPGHAWHVAFNVAWAKLRDVGLEAEKPGVSMDDLVELTGRPHSALKRAVSWGQLPVTRPWKPGGAQATSQVNPADLALFEERFPARPKGRPRKKD
ncbi:MAG: hypothetical protein LBT40_12215 [Deltaproteobacteria bacterium]|jgi:hypothetical protein|nr:hypothetical protein [Deltaproteobacteria bacterium]